MEDYQQPTSVELNEVQKQAFAQIQQLLSAHFDAAVCIIAVESPNDARQEHYEFFAAGSPSRALALAHLSVPFAFKKFGFFTQG